MHDGGCSKASPFLNLATSRQLGERKQILSRRTLFDMLQNSDSKEAAEEGHASMHLDGCGLERDLPASGWLRVDAHRLLSRRRFLRLAALSAATPVFDVRLPRGLDFTLQNSSTAQKYLIETMPGGVA